MIGFTTGRETNQRLNSLLKELTHVIPRSQIIRRGKSNREELAFRLYENGFTHAIGIYRQHGGPGRIDFFTVNPDGMPTLSPSALLKSVKLGREYQNRTKCTATAVTHNVDLTEETLLFCHTLSTALELTEVGTQQTSRLSASFHVADLSDRTIKLSVTSPAARNEVGPTLSITRLLWDHNDEDH